MDFLNKLLNRGGSVSPVPIVGSEGVSNTPATKTEHEVKVQFTREFADAALSSSGPESLSSASSFQSLASTVSSKSSSGICVDSVPNTPRKASDTSYIDPAIEGLDDLILACGNIRLDQDEPSSLPLVSENLVDSTLTLTACDSSFQLQQNLQDVSNDQTFASATDGSILNGTRDLTPDPTEDDDYPADLKRSTNVFKNLEVDDPACNETENLPPNLVGDNVDFKHTRDLSPIPRGSGNNCALDQLKELSTTSNIQGNCPGLNETKDLSTNSNFLGSSPAVNQKKDLSIKSNFQESSPAVTKTKDLSSNSNTTVNRTGLNETADLSSNSVAALNELVLKQSADLASNSISTVNEPGLNQTADLSSHSISEDIGPILNQTRDLSPHSSSGVNEPVLKQTADSSPQSRSRVIEAVLNQTADLSSYSTSEVNEPVLNQTVDFSLNHFNISNTSANQTCNLSSVANSTVDKSVLSDLNELFIHPNSPGVQSSQNQSEESREASVDKCCVLNGTLDLCKNQSVNGNENASNKNTQSLTHLLDASTESRNTDNKLLVSDESKTSPENSTVEGAEVVERSIEEFANGNTQKISQILPTHLYPDFQSSAPEELVPKEPEQPVTEVLKDIVSEVLPEVIQNVSKDIVPKVSCEVKPEILEASVTQTVAPEQLVAEEALCSATPVVKGNTTEILGVIAPLIPESTSVITEISKSNELKPTIEFIPVLGEDFAGDINKTQEEFKVVLSDVPTVISPKVTNNIPIFEEVVAESINKIQEKAKIVVTEGPEVTKVPTVASPKTTKQFEVFEVESTPVQENLSPITPIIIEESISVVSKQIAGEVLKKPVAEIAKQTSQEASKKAAPEDLEKQLPQVEQVVKPEVCLRQEVVVLETVLPATQEVLRPVTPVQQFVPKDLPEHTEVNKVVSPKLQSCDPQSSLRTKSVSPLPERNLIGKQERVSNDDKVIQNNDSSGDEELNKTVTLQDTSFQSPPAETTGLYAAFKPQQQSTTLGTNCNFEKLELAAQAVAKDIYNRSLELVEESDQFVSAECDLFQDSSIFDYLLAKSNKNPVRDLRTDSLYVKFDPLVSNVSMLPQGPTQPTDGEENGKISTPPPVIDTPKRNPALAAIDRLLFYSPATGTPLKAEEEPEKIKEPEVEPIPEPIPVVDAIMAKELELVRSTVVQLEEQLEKQKKEHEKELDMQKTAYQEKLEHLQTQLSSEVKNKNQMTVVVDEYEKSISRLVAERERDRVNLEQERTRLQEELQAANHHLNNTEAAFNDVHLKYERLKGVVSAYKSNEEVLKESIAENVETIKALENRYDQLKSHAMSQLEKANLELDAIRKQNEAETVKLQAMVRKADLKSNSLAEMVEQKIKENKELTQILDEVIARVGHQPSD